MNTATVTSKSNGSVYLVTAWPADMDDDDIRPGWLWVTDADGTQFSVRESKVIEGGEYVKTAQKIKTAAERDAEYRAEVDAIVENFERRERKENRRSYYLRTGR